MVEEINPGGSYIRFENGREYTRGEESGVDTEAMFAAQLRHTIEEHFRKQQRYEHLGIKVLSLIFIDRVANYRTPEGDPGIIRQLFDREFEQLKTRYAAWANKTPDEVQTAYFAAQRSGGKAMLVDSTESGAKRDDAAYDLIMRDKERLLSFGQPVAFIFSHSALREGWDNPNVFQICTLNQTASEMKKRQEIGRGVRLAVNQQGGRTHDEQVNLLTVIANESYQDYVATLQQEYVEYGAGDAPPLPIDARTRGVVRLRKQRIGSTEFKELWERIKQKTRYAVTVHTDQLITDVVAALDEVGIAPPHFVTAKVQPSVGEADTFETTILTTGIETYEPMDRPPLPNLVDVIADMLAYTASRVCVSKRTILRILQQTTKQSEMVRNPQAFATEAVRILRAKLAEQMVAGIQYERINEWYEMTQFKDEESVWEQYLVPCDERSPSLYDHVKCDSDVEKAFVAALNHDERVKCFVKLPGWFKVPTPVGEYNPDWAIVWEERDVYGGVKSQPLMYLVRETKGTTDLDRLPHPDEKPKLLCSKKHFLGALNVNYDWVKDESELPTRH